MAELESEGTKTRGGVADFLREFADELDEIDRRLGEADLESAAIEDDREPAEMEDDRQSAGIEGDEETTDATRITLIVGGDSATVTVPQELEFDVEVDSRSPMLGSGVRQEIEFVLSWAVEDPDELTDDLIQIE